MKKSGLADSPFFLPPQAKNEDLTPPLAELPAQKDKVKQIKKTKEQKFEQSPNDDTVIPRHHDTTVPRVHGVMVELVRKAVKEFGKEAATHRFTMAEKRSIADIIF